MNGLSVHPSPCSSISLSRQDAEGLAARARRAEVRHLPRRVAIRAISGEGARGQPEPSPSKLLPTSETKETGGACLRIGFISVFLLSVDVF